MASILITGGTGTLGRMVVPLMRERGHDVIIASRRPDRPDRPDRTIPAVAVDLGSPAAQPALVDALSEVDVVIHLAGSAKGDDAKTANLLKAIGAAGTKPQLVAMSVVGADRTPVVSRADRALFGYIAAKRESEQLIARSGLPWTVLRATQFHEFVVTLARTAAKLPIVMMPGGTRIQPVDGHEVAHRIVDLALGEPAGLVEIGGPTIYDMTTLVRDHLRAQNIRRPVVGIRMPGRAAAAFRAGANLNQAGETGRRTFEDFTGIQRTGAEQLATSRRGIRGPE